MAAYTIVRYGDEWGVKDSSGKILYQDVSQSMATNWAEKNIKDPSGDMALISSLQAKIAEALGRYNEEMAKDGPDRNANPATLAAQVRSLQQKLAEAQAAPATTATTTTGTTTGTEATIPTPPYDPASGPPKKPDFGGSLPAGYKLHTNRIGNTNTFNYRVSGPNGFNSAGHATKEEAINAANLNAADPSIMETYNAQLAQYNQYQLGQAQETAQGVSDVVETIKADPSGSVKIYADEITGLVTQLNELNKEYGENPPEEVINLIAGKEKELLTAQNNLKIAQQFVQQGQAIGASNLMSKAVTDPTALLEEAKTTTIDTESTEIAAGTGQVTGEVTPVTGTTATAETAATPETITAATYDAATVGTGATADAATGVVSDEAQVTAQQGAISSLAEGQVFDEDYIQQVQAGTRQVTPEELVDYARANNIPTSEAAKMLEPYLNVQAAKFVGETPQAEAQDIYSLTPTQIAQQTATKVQDAAKASEIPTASEAITSYQSTVQGAQGSVGANELVNAKDIIGAEKAITAVAATMEALNEDAIAVAATGSFSQAALAKAEQGTVPPQATIQGQMASLMEQFNNGTPAWAAGAMRAANAAMAARGLGGSSMAGAAIVQATMEAALPIAQSDAQAFFTMNMQNLNNRQQVALANAAAQQNIELVNLNNQQQVALQNSANAFSLQSQNLSNLQAVVLANAQLKSAFQNKTLDINTQSALTNAARYAESANINLSNTQQATLQRSTENLQVELTNLSNVQQASLANLQVRAALIGQELTNEQQMAVLQSTQDFERANFDASAKQQAFLQDAQAKAALEGRAMDIRQQTQLFNVSAILEERQIELSNEQQTRLFNSTNKLSVDMAELSNRQQTALANAQIEAALRGQELSNKQQSAVLNAEKFAEANNLTFTTEQQTKLYNSQLMQTVGMANLNNKQAAALQNAATLAGMDMANLNNRQQAAVVNAQSFLQMDMSNLNNEQQAAMFTAQAQQQVLLSDQAAENAAFQFNSASENQTEQFMATLSSQISQFNTAQKNAMEQFNADEANAIAQFNASLQNQREQFNATNALVVAQANAQWRQSVSTTEFAAQHEANLADAKAANELTSAALDQLYQRERDIMAFSFTASESAMDRMLNTILADKELEAVRMQIKAEKDAANSAAWGAIAAEVVGGLFG